MKIQFNTDKNINSDEAFRDTIITMLEDTLSRFEDHITRLEVHMSDENSAKTGPNDKRSMIEARMENRQPIAVTANAESYIEAATVAAGKVKTALDSMIGKMRDR